MHGSNLRLRKWTGNFKCRTCGEPITDSYRIQGILHHGCDLECETCAAEALTLTLTWRPAE